MSKKSNLKSPCCKASVAEKKLTKISNLQAVDGTVKRVGQPVQEAFLELLSSKYNLYQWACDDCIKDKTALLANPKKQFYTFKNPWDTATPFLAYFDKNYTCEQCEERFVFTKKEQQHWYEELQFIVYSKPKQCATCRKENRAAKNINTELSNLLKDGKPDNLEQLLRIAEIYTQMDKPDKAKAYQRAAEKLKKE